MFTGSQLNGYMRKILTLGREQGDFGDFDQDHDHDAHGSNNTVHYDNKCRPVFMLVMEPRRSLDIDHNED